MFETPSTLMECDQCPRQSEHVTPEHVDLAMLLYQEINNARAGGFR